MRGGCRRKSRWRSISYEVGEVLMFIGDLNSNEQVMGEDCTMVMIDTDLARRSGNEETERDDIAMTM